MLEWRKDGRRFTNGAIGRAGAYDVFSISWDGLSGGVGKDGPWILYCSLPGIKDQIGHFENQDVAKERAEKIIAYWPVRAGLKQEES